MIPLQETFDTVVAHLRNQNEKAESTYSDGNVSCKYLTYDGKTCAAGCLIKPKDYSKDFEGKSVCDLLGGPSIVGEILINYGHNLKLVRELQIVHDQHKIESWEDDFERIASNFSLTYVPKTN